MKELLTISLYRLLLPVLFILAFPGWLLKMLRRGGFGSGLQERIGIYTSAPDFEPSGAVHFHAISVGETILALKLIREWSSQFPDTRIVLAVGTSTAHDLAVGQHLPQLRVTYIPLDFPWMIGNYLRRFEPSQFILLEGDIWPNFLRIANNQQIPVKLANARVSPRSSRRFLRFAPILRPFFSKISSVCIQEIEHASLWQSLGIAPQNIHHTGSIKFDTESTVAPVKSQEFTDILAEFGENRPIILAASTFPGEEVFLTEAIWNANPEALPVIVPRHAERRSEVLSTLTQAGFQVTLRTNISDSAPERKTEKAVLIIDTTGELATWTSHADIVIIGKSFLSKGGQNPAEAILARKPLILGPNMQNFQPLVRNLISSGAVLTARTPDEISSAIRIATVPEEAEKLTSKAFSVLSEHHGATKRHLNFLQQTPDHA
ncbi:3-deoxy-D-manno-octulosonic acid transferase [Luteolibacter sp. AS25]|uniref:3-deoxy-D-manno-octulosonic acid transferase n=1 Tax=Luteolibacter sp. AS25 TaxID=3135776 RepID=UPI00398B2A2C